MQLVTGCTCWAFIWRHIMSGKYHCKYPITHRVSENSESGWEKNDALKHKNCTRRCRLLWQAGTQKMEMWVNGKTSNTLGRSFSRCSQFAGNTEIQTKGESSSSSCCQITALACSVIENSDGGQWGGGELCKQLNWDICQKSATTFCPVNYAVYLPRHLSTRLSTA